MPAAMVKLFLSGDLMLGRGVDQILPYPGDPSLREPHVADATTYVELAERANGPIPRPVGFAWPWGEALDVLEAAAPDGRVVNLETAVTRSARFAAGKAIHYRMEPDNLPCLVAARPDVCVLANNHVLDLGVPGLQETLEVLDGAGLRVAGAGRDAEQAWRPAVIPLPGGGRVLVFAVGMASSGVPAPWAATATTPGVAFQPAPSVGAAEELAAHVERYRRAGDLVVASVHWGSNWGYDVTRGQVRFAHALIDRGVDLVHGHSSHHPRPIEVYRDRLILYGCGDLVNDYEGISGHEEYRHDLRPLYLATLEADGGALEELRVVVMQARRLRLVRASREDTRWLRATLDRVSRPLGARVALGPDDGLTLRAR
jgi:poly-gamma-glutamate capsule biosynthesis protein CapA/YwtB (metallophosphatase superfamily)